MSAQPGYDYIAAAYAGVTDQIGEAGRRPAQFTIAIGDVSTGVAAAMAVGFALLHRERTGEGQYIDSAILDTYFHMHEVNVPRVALRGDKFTPRRTGSQHPDGGPTGLFRCSDGSYINITALAHQWGQLAAALGRPELVDDPRFKDARARRDNNDQIKMLIEDWLAGFPDRESALRVLEQHRVPCAPVLTLNEAVAHEHLRQRDTVRRVEDPQIGAFDIPGLPVKFSRWPDRTELQRRSPRRAQRGSAEGAGRPVGCGDCRALSRPGAGARSCIGCQPTGVTGYPMSRLAPARMEQGRCSARHRSRCP